MNSDELSERVPEGEEHSLFVDEPPSTQPLERWQESDSVPATVQDSIPNDHHGETQNLSPNLAELSASGAAPQQESESVPESSDTPLDRVELATILKDFDAKSDPLFSSVPLYMRAIVKDMLESEFLLVLGRGLGLAEILQLFLAKVRQASPGALVLILGSRSEDLNFVGRDGEEVIDFGISSTKRARLYSQGGVYSITAPIAVVDILTGVLNPRFVSGIVLAHAERVSEHSPTAFVLQLLRQSNNIAFIRALSDAPERIVGGSPALPLRLRVLGVRTISLWPRFHVVVDKSMPKLEVDEVIVEQPEPVRRMQALIAELMQAVLSDIKRRVPHLDVDFLAPAGAGGGIQSDSSVTAEALLGAPDLHRRIRMALEGVWHQISHTGRQSANSLSTLQQLLDTLTRFDARTFWEHLDYSRRDTSQPWTDQPAAEALYAEAKHAAVIGAWPAKFRHVRALLRDIEPGRRVLLVFRSQRSMIEMRDYLAQPDERVDRQEDDERRLEAELRRAEEEAARARAEARAKAQQQQRPGRRRVRGGSAIAASPSRSPAESAKTDDSKCETPDHLEGLKRPQDKPTPMKRGFIDLTEADDQVVFDDANKKSASADLNSESKFMTDSRILELSFRETPLHMLFTTYENVQSQLATFEPHEIIMYDPDLSFTREVERYAAGGNEVNLHFVYYQRSVEELQYLNAMRREKEAFTRLIREKGLMPMTLRDGEDDPESTTRAILGARRSYVTNQKQRIVVDVREFRSALPFLVWQSKMEIVPVTLLVGDYILTPKMCVERKSVTDLIGSFRDGRLYAQCESMFRHYKIAILLIEFDSLSHFTMEPFKDIRSRTSAGVQREIQQNLATLLLRFPKLKLVWSASPLHTATIFKGLKEFEEDPDPEECAKAGQTVLFDSVALGMLEALPGITPQNAVLLSKRVSTIAELCELSRSELESILGPENGGKLYRFITESYRNLA